MTKTPFAHFDRTLGAEHRAKLEKDVEAGLAPPPKEKRPRRSRPPSEVAKLDRNGKVRVEFSVSPKFTAAAALQAAREGTTTQVVAERWITTLAFAEVPENPAPREVMFSMHLAVGPDAFPPDVFEDLCRAAERLGVSPERLATGIVKQALAGVAVERRERTTISLDARLLDAAREEAEGQCRSLSAQLEIWMEEKLGARVTTPEPSKGEVAR